MSSAVRCAASFRTSDSGHGGSAKTDATGTSTCGGFHCNAAGFFCFSVGEAEGRDFADANVASNISAESAVTAMNRDGKRLRAFPLGSVGASCRRSIILVAQAV